MEFYEGAPALPNKCQTGVQIADNAAALATAIKSIVLQARNRQSHFFSKVKNQQIRFKFLFKRSHDLHFNESRSEHCYRLFF